MLKIPQSYPLPKSDKNNQKSNVLFCESLVVHIEMLQTCHKSQQSFQYYPTRSSLRQKKRRQREEKMGRQCHRIGWNIIQRDSGIGTQLRHMERAGQVLNSAVNLQVLCKFYQLNSEMHFKWNIVGYKKREMNSKHIFLPFNLDSAFVSWLIIHRGKIRNYFSYI